MRKESWFTAAVLWTLASWFAHPAIAQQPAPANKEPAETLLQKAERMLLLQKAELALDQDTTLEFVDTPLNMVLGFMADQHDVKIDLAPETAKGPKAVQPGIPVTKGLRKVSLRSALHLLLDEHGLEVTTTPQGKLLVVNSTPELRAKRVESKVQKARRDELERKLKTGMAAAEFSETPLNDVLAFLADQCGCTIVLDGRATSAGISRKEPVSVSRSVLPLGELLKRVLLPLDLQATIQDEVILVVPRDPLTKDKPSAEVAEALDKKLDLNLTATLPGLALHLTEVTGVPFLLHTPALKAAKINLQKSSVIKHQQVTPLQILQGLPATAPLKLLERDGVVLITAEPKK